MLRLKKLRFIKLVIRAGLIGSVVFYSPLQALADKASAESIKQAEEQLLANTVSSLADLASRYRSEQGQWRVLMPPDAELYLRQPCGMVVFNAKSLPSSFASGLIGKMVNGCPVYMVILAEDPVTRETVIANADGKEIAALMPEAGYNPYWYLEALYPDLYSGTYSVEELGALKATYDPSRIQVTMDLLPEEYVKTYAKAVAEEQAKATQKVDGGGGVIMMSYQGPAVENLKLVGIERQTNGIRLTLAYPWVFTNRVDFFTCTDLVASWWELAVDSTNVNTSTNWIEWTDTGALSLPRRFYAAGNADKDSDADGLTDAREKFMYHTCATNSDSDLDGQEDWTEIMTLHTDPNNNDTNKPTISISYPANESRKVWQP